MTGIIKNKNTLLILRGFYKKRKRMPSFSELGNLLGFKSKNTVYKLVKSLVNDGVISQDKTGRIIPTNLFGQLKVLGTIEAGFPGSAEEQFLDTITLDEWLVENREASFILKVTGDSMKDAGIQQGDIVVVERGKTPKEGSIVIAEIDGKWTMKYLRKKDGISFLEPANKKYKPIYPKESLEISAVVVGVIRKYK